MKILLVQPRFGMPGRLLGAVKQHLGSEPGRDTTFDLIVQVTQTAAPLSLQAVAASIPARHSVHIMDLLELEDHLEQALIEFQPDLVGITCMYTSALNGVLKTIRAVRAIAPTTFLIVGGHVATLSPEFVATPEVDAIALGEAEVIMPALLERLEAEQDWHDLPGLAFLADGHLQLPPGGPQFVEDLDELPLLLSHLTAPYAERQAGAYSRQLSAIVSSRGCPFRCTFCAVQAVYQGRFRCMSAERVVREIENSPGEIIGYMDDNFLTHLPRAHQIATLLLERGVHKEHIFTARSDTIARAPELLALWRQAGLTDVFIGFESASDERLQSLGKGNCAQDHRRAIELLHRLNVRINGYFLIMPDFVEEDFQDLHRFVSEMEVDRAYYSILTPYPGTPLWDQCQHELTTRNWDYFDNVHAVLPTHLPLPTFYRLCLELAGDALTSMPYAHPRTTN